MHRDLVYSCSDCAVNSASFSRFLQMQHFLLLRTILETFFSYKGHPVFSANVWVNILRLNARYDLQYNFCLMVVNITFCISF